MSNTRFEIRQAPFNHWLIENANQTTPNIKLLDNSMLTPKETAEITDRWIQKK